MANFPERDIALVICPKTIGSNLKVSNLYNMLAYVKHEWIVIVDSDIRVGTAYLRSVMPLLADERVGLVTCLYRAAQAPAFAARLEAIGITADFVPGVLAAWLLEGMHFALGSTMALTRTTLKAVGGFQAIGDYLADDFMLGNLIAKAGYEVCLARYVVEVVVAPMGFYDMLKHQLRWSRSMRFSRPVGYLGAVLTHGTALALLNLLVHNGAVPSLALLGVALSVRLGMAWLIGIHWLDDKVLHKSFWLLPLRDLLNFGIWCLGLVGKRVEWRGRLLEIIGDGKIVQVR
jgi:ceramide glucosyltransferase